MKFLLGLSPNQTWMIFTKASTMPSVGINSYILPQKHSLLLTHVVSLSPSSISPILFCLSLETETQCKTRPKAPIETIELFQYKSSLSPVKLGQLLQPHGNPNGTNSTDQLASPLFLTNGTPPHPLMAINANLRLTTIS